MISNQESVEIYVIQVTIITIMHGYVESTGVDSL